MRANTKSVIRVISAIVGGLLVSSVVNAATIPGSIYSFAPQKDTFVVKSKGWSDPAFGDKGWTHSSDWGNFSATQGQVITITMQAADVGIHPGATVWFRGVDDTAPDNYVVDHFYPQTTDFILLGAVDEATGLALGDIVMKHVTHGYDLDNNTVNATVKKPLKGRIDNVPGRLVLSFKAPYTGNYMFVVGGFNPDATVDTTKKYNIDVNLKFGVIQPPVVVTP